VYYRQATVDDSLALAWMNWHLIRDESHRNPMTVPELEARMSGWLSGEYRAILFEDNSGPAGYVLYRIEAEHIYIRQFFVTSERRQRGAGRAAMAWLRENVWGSDARLRVDVLVDNAVGLGFWRAVGFVDYSLTLECD
jgi:GNAT superfamily N-acetyltransferase